MAGAGYRNFQTGEVLTATNVNTYLNEQTVMVFADAAARTTALSGVLAEGMVTYLKDTNQIEVYNGSSWVGTVRTDVANTFTTGTQTVETGGGGTVGLVIKGVLTQSSDLQQWQTSAGSTLTRIDAFGRVGIRGAAGLSNAVLSVIPDATTSPGIVVRGAASQTADLQQWQSSAGASLAYVSSVGAVAANYLQGLGATTPYMQFTGNDLILFTRNAAYKGLIIRGATSQSADLQQWQSSTGTVLASISSGGNLTSNSIIATGVFRLNLATGTGSTAHIVNTTTTNIGLMIRGAVSQTADLQQWQSSAGTVMAKITNVGGVRATNSGTLNTWILMDEQNTGGFLRIRKQSAATTNPGADTASLYFRDGTTAGTLKLVVRAGASGAETTILDNIPQ